MGDLPSFNKIFVRDNVPNINISFRTSSNMNFKCRVRIFKRNYLLKKNMQWFMYGGNFIIHLIVGSKPNQKRKDILGGKACTRKVIAGRKSSTCACMEDLTRLGLVFL